MSLLKRIESPADLKKIPPEQFPKLCQEVRDLILSVLSNVGGHLASNLGVVELTVALHYLLDTPRDKIVWDTSKPNGQPRRGLDVSRAEEYFGFRAQMPFEEGLRRTIAWFKENQDHIV